MGRSINVAPIGFHNLSRDLGEDTIVIKYDRNKCDKKGDKTSPKNCYANPFDALLNLFLALGCYICLNQDKYDHDKDIIFLKNGKDRSASDTYCKALKELVNSSEARKAKVYRWVIRVYICSCRYEVDRYYLSKAEKVANITKDS